MKIYEILCVFRVIAVKFGHRKLVIKISPKQLVASSLRFGHRKLVIKISPKQLVASSLRFGQLIEDGE